MSFITGTTLDIFTEIVLHKKNKTISIGKEMHEWASDLFPLNRSITGAGVRETLNYIKNILPDLEILTVPTGYKAFDWLVPKEWSVTEAYIENKEGSRIIDFKKHNLHLVGYSMPVDLYLSLEELQNHLFSLPDQPEVIPYITSYYKENWGFCLPHNQRLKLKEEKYHIVIKSELKPGVLNYGEILIKGKYEKEIFLSTYICHPSMANNELSGSVVATALARYILSLKNREFSYRFVFVPETIGSLVYLSKNLVELKTKVHAGFNLTCIGDDRCYSYLPSRNGDTISDKVAKHVLKHIDKNYRQYTWLDRGSDERQYCSPGVDLPVASIMRSKYNEYPEYHTSADDLGFVTPRGLEGGFDLVKKVLDLLESNRYYKACVFGEPQLGKRGLYPNLSKTGSATSARFIVDVFSFCDGNNSVLDIAEKLNVPFWDVLSSLKKLDEHSIIEVVLES